MISLVTQSNVFACLFYNSFSYHLFSSFLPSLALHISFSLPFSTYVFFFFFFFFFDDNRAVALPDDKIDNSKDTEMDIEKDKIMEKERQKIKEKEKEFTVNFAELGRRFELTPGSIQSAIARACAEVSATQQKLYCTALYCFASYLVVV